jgi:predicted NBD/HSP70 family sugar kinase
MIFSPSRMGRLNKRALIRQLQKAGVASRADLARALGMSQPTAGKIVDELLALKVLEEVEAAGDTGCGNGAAAQLGRPGRQLRLNRSQPSFLGIQLGITETWLAELTLGATDKDDWQMSFRLPAGADPATAWERQLRAAAKKLGARKFLGVLLSVPGVVDESASRILFSPNIHWSEKAVLPDIIRRLWNAPVLLVQEEYALALGHHVNQPGHDDFLLVDFGDGVGGAVLVGGKPLASPLPIRGEIGHTPVLGNQRKCGCGATGCMETLVSVRGLLESFSAVTRRGNNSWAELHAHVSRNGVEPWLAASLDATAAAIAGSLNVLGLRRVVITGNLAELPPAVMQHLSRAIENGAMWARFGQVECVAAPRRRMAGLVAVGIDRFIVPDREQHELPPAKISPDRNAGPKLQHQPTTNHKQNKTNK